ncbi:DNA cytosine methyltransferase [Sphingomonas aracearum]|uniref:DNA cytosine methyltransferase n=2 Tax=Sphingomonas aracearum TaxID=2283317 RepID=A0A369VQU3_9SPHN|nr:DNA cytosine methyltransferase [Sphingomonas aracearum]
MACGIGSGARGFNGAQPRVGHLRARFECAGGIDVDPGAIRNFERLTGVKGTVMDLFNREQYRAFHGREPGADWREAIPADVRGVFGHVDVCLASYPCKGFSSLLSQAASLTAKYQALNALTLRGMWLTLEAYKDDPIPILLFENVPRIATRGRWLLDQIVALLHAYGYSVNEDVHDCGLIGNLAQSRKRFLLIARHPDKVPPFIYQPRLYPLRGVGEVIGELPLPGDPRAGSMHRVPALQWKTWVRLAFVEAGSDWRSLNRLRVENGVLADYGIVPEPDMRENAYGVCRWEDRGPLVTSARAPGQGRFSVADPRPFTTREGSGFLGVNSWIGHVGTISSRGGPTNGSYAIADPRPGYGPATHTNLLSVTSFDQSTRVVSGAVHVAGGALSVADPRYGEKRDCTLGVLSWSMPTGVVQGKSGPTNGTFSIADPRPAYGPDTHRHVLGVHAWSAASGVLTGNPKPTSGAHCVADPRIDGHPSSVQCGIREWSKPAGVVTGNMWVGSGPTATLALDFGRSCSAIYARAGCLELTEGNPPEWTEWEDAQLRAGYARSVPLLQLAALIGRPLSGLSGRAGLLGITHASHPPDWGQAEMARALDLATEGYRYTQIIAMMAAEGFPARTLSGFGQIIRKLGYGRGWGRAWTPDEDALLRHAYEAAASLTPLRARLGRTACSLRWRAEYLGLRGTHANRNGWRMGPDWTEAQEALLRERYGKMPNDALAAQLGRTKAAMFSRANLLGLVHGYIRPFSADETRALDLAFRHSIAIADLAAALDRKACSVSKYATNHGIRFGRRPLRTPTPTLGDILALDAPTERGGGACLIDHVIEQSPERPHADDQHDARDARRERRTRRIGRRRPLRHEARRQERRLNRRP